MPDFYKKMSDDMVLEENFEGDSSGRKYTYYEDGFHLNGSHCMQVSFQPELYNETIKNIFDDHIVGD